MGDVTYRHVFQDMTTESRRASMMLPVPADITEESPFSRATPVQEPVQVTPGQESEAGSPRYDCMSSISFALSVFVLRRGTGGPNICYMCVPTY